MADLAARYEAGFGPPRDGLRWFSAPGRTELGGNHTDHQQGCVLAAAVSLDALAAAALNGEKIIRIISDGYPKLEIAIDDLSVRPDERESSAAMVRGVAGYFARKGRSVGGFDAVVTSDVPGGSGLSSSACFEVLVGSILCGLFNNGEISPVEIAKAGQYAENVYFGKPSGLMDQMASSLGGVSAMDFGNPDSPAVRRIPFDFEQYDHALCIIDTGASHADLNDAYASIPSEMRQVAGFLGGSGLREVPAPDFYKAIPDMAGKMSDRAILRAMHFYADNERAVLEADALTRGDMGRFLELVNESGRSSWMFLQNICPPGSEHEQPAALALAYCEHLLAGTGACRIHGGGFAGTIQAFVPLDRLDDFRRDIEKLTGTGSCRVLSVRNIGGTEIIL
jgi:galactokinase